LSVGSRPNVAEVGAGGACTGAEASKTTLGVCHIASGDRWAGAEVQLTALLKSLRQSPDLRVSAIFLNEGRPAEEARQIEIDVCIFDETQQSFFRILSGAGRFLAGRNVQVLHSHRYKENLLAALLSRWYHVPIHVSSQHGAPEPFKGWRRLRQGAIQALDHQVALRATDRVISVSDELRARLTRSLPESKVITIHNGIDEDKVFSRYTAAEAKQRLGIPADSAVVGTAGRLDPIKRLDIFLNAAVQIGKALPNTRFMIVGDGAEASRLHDLADSLGLNERLLFLGHRDDIYDVIRAMDIFVFCSDHEGLPMALLESLYLRIPVVARPVGGIAEVIQDGISGVCVHSAEPEDLASACISLLLDDSRRSSIARTGTALVAKQFTAGHTAAQTAVLYRSLSGLR
jgi:glycosyltransferase involved in cell wall biosynthesis